MPQRFYYDENDLDGTINKLDRNLMEMLDFAYLHEDMVNTIEELMSDWGKENLPTYAGIIEEYENMDEDQKNGTTMLTNTSQSLDVGGWKTSVSWTIR